MVPFLIGLLVGGSFLLGGFLGRLQGVAAERLRTRLVVGRAMQVVSSGALTVVDGALRGDYELGRMGELLWEQADAKRARQGSSPESCPVCGYSGKPKEWTRPYSAT